MVVPIFLELLFAFQSISQGVFVVLFEFPTSISLLVGYHKGGIHIAN